MSKLPPAAQSMPSALSAPQSRTQTPVPLFGKGKGKGSIVVAGANKHQSQDVPRPVRTASGRNLAQSAKEGADEESDDGNM